MVHYVEVGVRRVDAGVYDVGVDVLNSGGPRQIHFSIACRVELTSASIAIYAPRERLVNGPCYLVLLNVVDPRVALYPLQRSIVREDSRVALYGGGVNELFKERRSGHLVGQRSGTLHTIFEDDYVAIGISALGFGLRQTPLA